jgi:hypothetical protein
MKNDLKDFGDSNLVKEIKKIMESSENITEKSKETPMDERALDTEFSAGSSMAAGAGSGETHALVHRQTGKVVKKFNNFNSALSAHSRMPDNKNYVIKPLSTFEEVESEEGVVDAKEEEMKKYEYYIKEYLKLSNVESLSDLSEEEQKIAMDIIELAYDEQVDSFDQLDEISTTTLDRAKASVYERSFF